MASTTLTFASREAHRAWLSTQAILPAGFRVGSTRFEFVPVEVPKPAAMNLTLIALDKPTPDFAAVFTRNAFPGAPVIIGRRRLDEPSLGAIVVNNKISNVCAPDGVATAERLCAGVAGALGMAPGQILPSSTGVIGWRIPIEACWPPCPPPLRPSANGAPRRRAVHHDHRSLPQGPPRQRRQGQHRRHRQGRGHDRAQHGDHAGLPLTDLAIPRASCAACCRWRSIRASTASASTPTPAPRTPWCCFPRVPCLAATKMRSPAPGHGMRDLAEDVVRNGEGVRHVVRTSVRGAPSETLARALGKAVINAPLVKCAMAGNDPNVGRIIMAIGKHVGIHAPDVSLDNLRIALGGKTIFERGSFQLDPAVEKQFVEHLKQAELYQSVVPADGVFHPAVDFPPHERCVELDIDLGCGRPAPPCSAPT
jgi:glutamate N-acetyltransferase/amino-acid N-acetyltransferase